MTSLPQSLNPIIADMAPDRLLGFQEKVRDIPGVLKLTFGEPGFAVDDRIKQAAVTA